MNLKLSPVIPFLSCSSSYGELRRKPTTPESHSEEMRHNPRRKAEGDRSAQLSAHKASEGWGAKPCSESRA